MAKLSSCYPLCPLIDRSPIGVTSDSDPGCAIVTLGKNIVIRYKLADQKQASSWSSKDKLSAPVIYDTVGKKYVAVFNQSIVRMWDSTDVDLNKLKKQRFDQAIHSVVNRSSNAELVVVFTNGAAVSISQALVHRTKKIWPGPVLPEMTIKESFFIQLEGTDCIAIVAANDKGRSLLEIVEVDKSHLFSIRIERPGKKLLGQTTMQSEGTVSLFTLWDDGQLFSLPLKKTTSRQDGVGSVVYSVKNVSPKNTVAMAQISTHHLAIYGADPSEEGAMLLIVNTEFMLVQANQHYKMFSGSTNLWIIGSNLLLVVGQSLAVVPFLLDTERLCALIGSHKPKSSIGSKASAVEQILEMENVTWDSDDSETEQDSSELALTVGIANLKNFRSNLESVKMLIAQGYSQAMLCEKLVPHLLDEFNTPILLWLLKNLPDFPEATLVHILAFCLEAPVNAFNNAALDMKPEFEIDGDDSRDSQNTLVELSLGQRTLLDVIIRTPFSEAVILPHLRSRLNLPHCLVLLQYVAQCLPQTKSISYAQALLRWSTILLDSHYQQLLLSKDECVSSTVTALKDLVESQIENMEELKILLPILERIKCGQSLQKSSLAVANNFYSIETLRLY